MFQVGHVTWSCLALLASSVTSLRLQKHGFWQEGGHGLARPLNFLLVRDVNDFRTLADFRSASSATLVSSEVHMRLPAAVHWRGRKNAMGVKFFAEALTSGLPSNVLEGLQQCHPSVLSVFDERYEDTAKDFAKKSPSDVWNASAPAIWIILNTEDMSGEETMLQVMAHMHPNDHAVILTNMFNDRVEAVSAERFSTLWVPGASLWFAERTRHTPMDLVYRGRVRFAQESRGTVAYQQHTCSMIREALFNVLTEELLAREHVAPSALSGCSGGRGLGSGYMPSPDGGCPDYTRFDQTVCRYEDFLFTESLEHKSALNDVGYVSEKIVDGFLAGAVPIYAGGRQVVELFDPGAFVHANVSSAEGLRATAAQVADLLENRSAYERMRHREPLVSHDALKKHFSWHPAVWETHGDELKWRILTEVFRHCSRIFQEEKRRRQTETVEGGT